jgi:CDP-4-dehydro-6-deoxyglucose reductase
MVQFLSLSKGARLVGTTRGMLQKKIQNGELSTFEGKVAVTDLLRVYPNTQVEDNTMLEQVKQIKANAIKNRGQGKETSLPSPEKLVEHIDTLKKKFFSVQSDFNEYVKFVETFTQKLSDVEKTDDANLRSSLHMLQDWLNKKMQSFSLESMESTKLLLAKNAIFRIMAAHVKVIPSGEEFFVEGKDSILEAALSAGLTLNYGCTNGNCGNCKARIISGEVQKICHHDYVISEAEKRMGYQLMCSYTPLTDITIEAAQANSVEDIPFQQISAKVKNFEYFADDLLVLYLQTPRTKTLRFFAGQMVTLRLENGISADSFIASCPCDGYNLEFHLHKMPGDKFTETLFSQLKKGQIINIEGPKGHFILKKESTRPTLLLAFNHGFAPIKSLIEYVIALDTVAYFHFYWIVSNKNGHYQHNQCHAWADALDNFKYRPLVTPSTDDNDIKQSLTKLVEDYPNLKDFEVYVAGSESFVKIVEEMLYQHQLPETQFHPGYL